MVRWENREVVRWESREVVRWEKRVRGVRWEKRTERGDGWTKQRVR